MPDLTLISHHLCPYVQRAVIALTEKGVAFERVYVDLANKPDWFKALSPLGKTPVLNREKLHELTAVNWQCSIEKAKTHLGFSPQYALKQGLRETLQWYRLNKWL